MQIFIKTLTGKSVPVCVSCQVTIAELKANVATRFGIPPVSFRFIFAGKQLEDNRTVASYKIQKANNLHFVLHLRGGHDGRGNTHFERNLNQDQDRGLLLGRWRHRSWDNVPDTGCTVACQFCDLYFPESFARLGDLDRRRCMRPRGHMTVLASGDFWHICERCQGMRDVRRFRRRLRSPRRSRSPDRRMRGNEDEDDRNQRRRQEDINWMRRMADHLIGIEERDHDRAGNMNVER